ncbi:maleylpyruvate isomerase [Kitasatospora sp. GAS204A]|uniref:maleylpyruvate isomerase family mycothiol-dependent enzyme n=1 Tax=unclassified Kitasatospora TaxID=2633591 RepID=UPI002475163A|nr:maleylpyruvate isomerase family mycothiol-dependent enzyme [Kitasatospora sp. GAS204B]MDH6121608.1 maleylpyruvate isomerase [Kitasatospora sp. GAS204B]
MPTMWSDPSLVLDPPQLLAEVTDSAARLVAAAVALDDAELRAPSTLAGWSREQVITHLAGAAEAYLRLLALARTGVEPTRRADDATPVGALRDGAARPAAALVGELRDRLDRLAEDAAAMPADRWDNLVTALAGWRHPAWFTLYRCWRELETHHVDLDLGYRPADWPEAYVRWALPDTLAALAAREFPVGEVAAVDLGRRWTLAPSGLVVSGSGHALLGWLAGRTGGAALVSDAPLPEPPSWPLPPFPGWN